MPGMQIPDNPISGIVIIRMPDDLRGAIMTVAKEDSIDISAATRLLIWEGLHNRKMRAETTTDVKNINTLNEFKNKVETISKKEAWLEAERAALEQENEYLKIEKNQLESTIWWKGVAKR